MSTWRDKTSEEAQLDLDSLVGASLEMAEKNLEDTGELRPFYLAVQTDGQKTLGTLGEELDSSEIVVQLISLLLKRRDQYRAVAIVKDVTLRGSSTEAIWVDICHKEGASMTCYLPYQLDDGKLSAGEMGAQASENLLW